jgi:flagellar basal body-associated protein FliL
MGESSTIIVLLTITVIILSVVIVALLAAVTFLLVRLNKIAKNVEAVSNNIAEATQWVNPTKLITTVINAIRR